LEIDFLLFLLTGKGLNIWDNFTHRDPSPIFDGSNGDVACNTYHNYENDVQMLKNAGVSLMY